MITTAGTTRVAVCVDIENFIRASEWEFSFAARAITNVLNPLRVYLRRQRLHSHSEWSRIYLESRSYSQESIGKILAAAKAQHFTLHWSWHWQAAELPLAYDIAKALAKPYCPLPEDVFILSGDGGLDCMIEKLHSHGHRVTIVGLTDRTNRVLRQHADQFLSFEELVTAVTCPPLSP